MTTLRAKAVNVFSCSGCDGIHIVFLDGDDEEIAELIFGAAEADQMASALRKHAQLLAARLVQTPPALQKPAGRA